MYHVIRAIKLGAMFVGHEATTNNLQACADRRRTSVGRRFGLEESGNREGAARRCGYDDGAVATKYTFANNGIDFVVGDVGRLTTARVRVTIEKIYLDAELSGKLC